MLLFYAEITKATCGSSLKLRWGTRNPKTRKSMPIVVGAHKLASCQGLKVNQKRRQGLNFCTNEYFKKYSKTRNAVRFADSAHKHA